jgi:hypothetical protein
MPRANSPRRFFGLVLRRFAPSDRAQEGQLEGLALFTWCRAFRFFYYPP